MLVSVSISSYIRNCIHITSDVDSKYQFKRYYPHCISDIIVVAKAGCSICCTSDYWVKTSTPPTQECGPWPGEGGATAAFAATAAAEAPVATEGEVLTGEHF